MKLDRIDLPGILSRIPPAIIFGWTLLLVAIELMLPLLGFDTIIRSRYTSFVLYFLTGFFSYAYLARFLKHRKLLGVLSVLASSSVALLLFFACWGLQGTPADSKLLESACLGAIVFGIVVLPKKPLTFRGRKI